MVPGENEVISIKLEQYTIAKLPLYRKTIVYRLPDGKLWQEVTTYTEEYLGKNALANLTGMLDGFALACDQLMMGCSRLGKLIDQFEDPDFPLIAARP